MGKGVYTRKILLDRIDVSVYCYFTIQVYRYIKESIMYEIKQLTTEEMAEVMKRIERDKYRKKLIEAAEALGAGMMVSISPTEFTSFYSSLTTLRVWVSKMNKKYSDRSYSVVTDDVTGNVCVCRAV
jgi:hypothetical protein